MNYPSYDFEKAVISKGYKYVAGTDCVGEGSLFGPIVAAAVHIPFYAAKAFLGRVNDSKKLSAEKRKELAKDILTICDCGIGIIDNKIIEEINVREAAKLAMKLALYDLKQYDYVFVDGPVLLENIEAPQEQVIKGDSLVLSIAAASVLAKVTRDTIIEDLAKKYDKYSLEKHHGYGTKEHRIAIALHGPSPLHRKTFGGVKEYI
jgi:ribonuclease HII